MALKISAASRARIDAESKKLLHAGHETEAPKPKKEMDPVQLLDSDKDFRGFFGKVADFVKKTDPSGEESQILEGADPSDPDFDTKLAQYEDRVKVIHEKFKLAKTGIEAVRAQYRSILNRDFQDAEIEIPEDDPVLNTLNDELTKLALEDFDPNIQDTVKDADGNDVENVYGTKKIKAMVTEMGESQKMDIEIAQKEKELKAELKKYGTSSEEVEDLVGVLKAAESMTKVEEEQKEQRGLGKIFLNVFSRGRFGKAETRKVTRELSHEELSDDAKAGLKAIMKDFGLTSMGQIAAELAKVEQHLEDVKQLEEKRAQLRLKKKEVLQFGDKSGKVVKYFQGQLKTKLDGLLASGTPDNAAEAAKLHKTMVERGGAAKEEGPHYVAELDKKAFTNLEKQAISAFKAKIEAAVNALDLTKDSPGADLLDSIREHINSGGDARRGEFRQIALDELAKLNKAAVKAKDNDKARYIKGAIVAVHKMPNW